MRLIDFPWLQDSVKSIGERLPSSLLLIGVSGLGKGALARALAKSMLCSAPIYLGAACHECKECILFESENHPDFRLITNDEVETKVGDVTAADEKKIKQLISVKSVRGLVEFSGTKPHRGYAKVVVINPAENLNQSASNALLKILEEPPEFLHFILVAKNAQSVIPTIRSRCLKHHVLPPSDEGAINWLKNEAEEQLSSDGLTTLASRLSSNAPLATRELLIDEHFFEARSYIVRALGQRRIDIFALAAFCEKLDPEHLRKILYPLIHDLLLLDAEGELYFYTDMRDQVMSIKRHVTGVLLIRWMDELTDYLKSIHHPLNRRLALEALFLKWAKN
jgi:DNA polymerase-3 subunit delta'